MKTSFSLLCTLFSTISFSQSIDYNKIIIPADVKDVSFEERLIQLAWNNHPSNKIVVEDFNHSAFAVKEARYNWLNDIYVVGNLNEFTINPNSDLNNRAQFFPKYNFTVRFSLGTFALTPIKVKAARSDLTMSNYLINSKKLEVRTSILSSIEQFKEYYKILRFRRQLMEDVLLVYKESEKQFYLGKIKIDEYRATSQAYSLRAESVITAESEFNQVKLLIEGMVGMPLKDLSGYDSFISSIESFGN
jgi:outer membrane protein TolC